MAASILILLVFPLTAVVGDRPITPNAQVRLSARRDVPTFPNSISDLRMLRILYATISRMNCEQFLELLGNDLQQIAEDDKNTYIKVRGTAIVLEFDTEFLKEQLVRFHLSPMFGLKGRKAAEHRKLQGLWIAHEITCNGAMNTDNSMTVDFEDDVVTFYPDSEFPIPVLFKLDKSGPLFHLSLVSARKKGNKFLSQELAFLPNRYKIVFLSDAVCIMWSIPKNRQVPSIWIMCKPGS